MLNFEGFICELLLGVLFLCLNKKCFEADRKSDIGRKEQGLSVVLGGFRMLAVVI
jgi:hypothetical protein